MRWTSRKDKRKTTTPGHRHAPDGVPRERVKGQKRIPSDQHFHDHDLDQIDPECSDCQGSLPTLAFILLTGSAVFDLRF